MHGVPNSIYKEPLALSHGITQKLGMTLSQRYHQIWVALSLAMDTKSWDPMMHDLFQFLSLDIRDEPDGINFSENTRPLFI